MSAEVRVAVRRALARHRSASVIVACSGGADSLALARPVAQESVRADVHAVAVVVDHGLQVGSRAVAQRAAGQCRDLGLEAHVVAVEVNLAGEGIEAAAREARYAALESAADAYGADAILLGHTLDDQAETVLIRLTRGSGARSLAGMASVAGRLVRPLLGISRATVRASVSDLDAWEDPHNVDDSMLRPRVRHELIPVLADVLGPGAVAALARTAALLRADADALDAWADREFASIASIEKDWVDLPVDALSAVPEAIRMRLIRRACITAGSPAGALTFDHVVAIGELVSNWRGQGAVSVPGPVTVERRYDRLRMCAGGASSRLRRPRAARACRH